VLTHEDDGARKLVGEAFAAAPARPAAGFEERMARALRAAQADSGGARHAVHGPHSWRLGRRSMVLLAAILVIGAATTAMAYPPAREAASQLSGLGFLGALFGAPAQPAATLAEATSDGTSVRITGGYDDGTTVMLNFEVTPAGQPSRPYEIGWGAIPLVTDSTGHQMDQSFTPARRALSTNALAYNRPVGGAPAGTPLTVQVSSIELLGSNVRAISGHWKMQLSLRPTSLTRELPLPASGRLGSTTIEFVTVRANDAYLHLQFTSDACHNKGCGIDTVVYGPDGRRLTMLNMSANLPGEGQGGRFMQKVEWQLADRPGTYRIVLTDSGQTLARTIVVPNGRSGSVPHVEGPFVR
jgi:hypothetical protein